MKTQIINFTITICALILLNVNAGYSKQTGSSAQQKDTLLNNIEPKINNAFVKDLMREKDSNLVAIEKALLDLNKNNNNSIIVYWYSYACYYHSIFSMVQNDLKKSEKLNNDGIDELNGVDPKSSEHYALLAFMESFSIKYASGMKAAFISASVKKNAEKALELDSLNLRAYYVLGSNDFYTPEQYGGGKKAEGYLKKAIQMNNQSITNPYLPSWGKNSAYELLIRLYIKRKQLDEAKKYYQQAIALYPKDYMIKKLTGELYNNSNPYNIQPSH